MSRRIIFILVLIMGMVLFGLIAVQLFWIKNAFKVKEKHFDQLIHRSLIEAGYDIQQKEVLSSVYEEFGIKHMDTSYSVSSGDYNFDTVIHFEVDTNNFVTISQDYTINKKTEKEEVIDNISMSAKGSVDQKPGVPPGFHIDDDLSDRRDFVDRVLARMFSFAPDIEKRITPGVVKDALQKALNNNGIKADFEYAVFKWNGRLAFKSKTFRPSEKTAVYKARLFPDDFFDSSDFLVIYFPNRINYIMQSLGLMGISSSVLTFLLMVTFAYTLYVILHQKRLSEMKNDFVNNLTHELKTPIATISLASQLLSDKSIPVKNKDYNRISEIITEESKRLGYQVERVLQMAKIDQDKLQLKFTATNMHEIIEAVVSNFILQVEAKSGMLIPSLHADNDLVFADAIHMTNVITNLLDNAVKYTSGKPEIYVETQNTQQDLCIKVRDNGIGISKANQRRIFDKFYRVSSGNVHDVKGFGLGLSYVKRIIEEHQGTVKVESELGMGSVFTVCLPLKK